MSEKDTIKCAGGETAHAIAKGDNEAVAQPSLAAIQDHAADAISQEHDMSLWKGLKTYPKAVGWSLAISTSIVMEGFDKALVASLFANVAFNEAYGKRLDDGSYQLSADWQTALTVASAIGEICGLAATGIISERFGQRRTMILSLVLVTAFIFIVFFSKSPAQLLVGQIVLGLPWGVFQTVTVSYAADVCPVVLRSYLTTYINLCWVFGQLLAAGVLRAMSERLDQWSYRIPFALQWMWPLPIMMLVWLAPESPWWLVRRGDIDRAKRSLERLTTRHEPDFDADDTVSMMIHTNAMEKAMSDGTSYWDCFRGTNLRRTEIACCTWLTQMCSGVWLMGYSPYFYVQAGLGPQHAFTLTMAQYALGAVGTFCSWALMARFGRRTLYLTGIAIMATILLVIGLVDVGAPTSNGQSITGWIVGSLLIIWTAVYDSTVGPVCYALVSELPSTRLRGKTIAIARICYNTGSIVLGVLTPRMLNPTEWAWGAKSGFFWAGSATLSFVWIFFRLPEPKGRTYGELDILFERRVPARAFSKTTVDALSEGNTIIKKSDVAVEGDVEHAE